jgi:large subunit ribosomal protein L9
MKIILLETVVNLGTVGDVVSVKDGYGRNFLIPQGLATHADERQVKALDHQKRMLEGKRRRELQKSEELAKELEGLVFTFSRKTADEGHMFGAVTATDIEQAIKTKGYTVTRKQIHTEQAIRSMGEHDVTIKLAGGVKAKVKVVVEKEA